MNYGFYILHHHLCRLPERAGLERGAVEPDPMLNIPPLEPAPLAPVPAPNAGGAPAGNDGVPGKAGVFVLKLNCPVKIQTKKKQINKS